VFFELLAAADIPFVIVGGHAVNFHGYIRTTEDADVIVARSEPINERLLRVLAQINAGWIADDIDPATGLERVVPITLPYIRSRHLMMLTSDLGFIDVFDYIPGFPETPVSEVFGDCCEHGDLRFVSLAWLRRIKEQAGRHKDLDDLENLPTSEPA